MGLEEAPEKVLKHVVDVFAKCGLGKHIFRKGACLVVVRFAALQIQGGFRHPQADSRKTTLIPVAQPTRKTSPKPTSGNSAFVHAA